MQTLRDQHSHMEDKSGRNIQIDKQIQSDAMKRDIVCMHVCLDLYL